MCDWILSSAPCHTSPATAACIVVCIIVIALAVIVLSPSPHRVSTAYPQYYPQKNRGVTGIDRIRYAPKTGYPPCVSSQRICPGEGSASIRAGKTVWRGPGARGAAGHALGLR